MSKALTTLLIALFTLVYGTSSAQFVPTPAVLDTATLGFDTTVVSEDAHTTKVRKLIEVSRTMENAVHAVQVMFSTMDQDDNPGMRRFIELVLVELKSPRVQKWYENQLIRSFKQFYTEDEVEELILFYQSPLGKKLLEVTPKQTAEQADFGGRLGEYLARLVLARLQN